MTFISVVSSFRIGILAGAAVLFAAAQGSQMPPLWRWSNPTPHGNNIADLAGANSFYVQVADHGQVYTSEDVLNWIPRASHTTNALRAVVLQGQRIIIVGERGTVVFGDSPDRLTAISLATDDWLEGVTASSATLVAVGDNGAIYTSANGDQWQRHNSGTSEWLRSVAFGTPGGTGLFVVAGENGFLATSPDGSTWQAAARPTKSHLNRVTWVDGQFLAVGDAGTAYSSANGRVWTRLPTGATNSLYAATAAASGSLLVAGENEARLKEGSVWTDQLGVSVAFPPPPATYTAAIWDGTSIVLAGRTGVVVEGFKTNAQNPTAWLPISEPSREWLWDVKRLGDFYFAVGDLGSILTSEDGRRWSQELPPASQFSSVYLGIGGSTNLAVAVGSGGTIAISTNSYEFVASTNAVGITITNSVSTFGLVWTAIEPKPVTNDLQGVTFFNNSFVASGGAGTILTSKDGVNWSRQKTPTTSLLSSVAPFDGGLVAVGKNGTILTSPDGSLWTLLSASTTNWIYRIRHFDGTLVAVGQNGTILTSSNAVQWASRKSGVTAWLTDVEKVGGKLFVTGTQGTVLTSTNLDSWENIGTITGKSLFGAASSEGQLVVAGVEGVILRTRISPVLKNPPKFVRHPVMSSDSGFVFAGEPDQRFRLDRSVDLLHWTEGPTLDLNDDTGTLIHLDFLPNDPSTQFYRTQLVP
ncbi:MAG: hypothetical protein EXS31_01555 [Pedosphaera sp.]|nr:hypothetical protein [Pedosphaera sp.]